jgi:hypothetical protein
MSNTVELAYSLGRVHGLDYSDIDARLLSAASNPGFERWMPDELLAIWEDLSLDARASALCVMFHAEDKYPQLP